MICSELMNGYWKFILFKLVIQVILIQSTNSYFTFRYLRIVVCRYTRNDKTEIILRKIKITIIYIFIYEEEVCTVYTVPNIHRDYP